MGNEAPFFANRRRRAGLVKRIGNLADKLDSKNPETKAMRIIATDEATPVDESQHLSHMIASHLEFVGPFNHRQNLIIAKQAGVLVEYINVANFQGVFDEAPEEMRAAFSDVATLVARNLE